MKVASKALYRELGAVLGPLMQREGFKRMKGGLLGWTNGGLTLWFQCDKWGWNERWGSRFTLEFRNDAGRSERIGYLLEGFDELDELRVRNNAVIERLPGSVGKHPVSLAEGYRVDPAKAVYGSDVWLHYYSVDDVRDWARYFESKLPRFVALFENETRSEQGKARIRFNQVMSKVQATADRAAKAALFEGYIRDENDAQFRSAAAQWLDTLKGTPA